MGKAKMKVARYENYGCGTRENVLSDFVAMLAANVEDAYLTAGIDDFSAKDCFDKAFLLTLKLMDDREFCNTISWVTNTVPRWERKFPD